MNYFIYVCYPIFIFIGHVGIIPFIFQPEIFGYDQRISFEESINIALIIAPLTSVSAASAVKFSIDIGRKKIGELPSFNNLLFPILSAITIIFFYGSIYWAVAKYQSTIGGEITVLKSFIGIIEVFLGASYALVTSTIFNHRE